MGAQVSCIKYDTVTEMGLLHQISDSSTCTRTANGQDVGVRGSIVVNFKIGPCSFTHKFIVCRGITRPFILGEEFLSHHCFKLGWTDDNKRLTEYRNAVVAVASQAVMDDQDHGFSCSEDPSKTLCNGTHKVSKHVLREGRSTSLP